MDDKKFEQIAQIAQRSNFSWARNFYGFIFWGPILLDVYFFGYHEKCLGRASLSYTSWSTLPGQTENVYLADACVMAKLKALCATAYGPSACERVNIFAHKLAYADIR